jgi:hypothetical protein
LIGDSPIVAMSALSPNAVHETWVRCGGKKVEYRETSPTRRDNKRTKFESSQDWNAQVGGKKMMKERMDQAIEHDAKYASMKSAKGEVFGESVRRFD